MEDKLKEIFGYVNTWLSHAETKNGALIVFNSAFVIGILTILLGEGFNVGQWLNYYLIITVLLLLTSTGISLLSFLPMTDKFKSNGDNNDADLILLFFGDIAKYKNSRQYVSRMYEKYFDEIKQEGGVTKLEDDYAKEIIYNSKIAMKKYKYFKMALFLTISAIMSLPLVLLIYSIIKIYKNING